MYRAMNMKKNLKGNLQLEKKRQCSMNFIILSQKSQELAKEIEKLQKIR